MTFQSRSAPPFVSYYLSVAASVLVTSLCELRISINGIGPRSFSLPPFARRHVVYISVPSLPFLILPSLATEDYVGKSFVVRKRKSSIRVCLPAIPIKGSIVLAIRELRRPRARARSCGFPRNWTGSILRGHPRISLPLFL